MSRNEIMETVNLAVTNVLKEMNVTAVRKPSNMFSELPEREKNMIRTLSVSGRHTNEHIAHVFDISVTSVRAVKAQQRRKSNRSF